MYKWVRTLTNCCLSCRKKNQIWKDENTAPNEKWGEEVPYPFHTVHIDHKGPLSPMSDGKHHCLVVIDAFSRFIQVYLVKITDATHTIEAMYTFITSFGIPQNLIMMEELPSWGLILLLSFWSLAEFMLPERNGNLGTVGKLKFRINTGVDISVATHLKLETNGPHWLVNLLFHKLLQ